MLEVELDPEQERVAAAARRLAEERLVVGSSGNVSLRAGDYALVTPTGAPAATALACVVDEVPVVHYSMLALGGAVRVAPYHTFGTPELAEAVLDTLEGRRAALMASHGAVVFAGDLEEAVELALLLEWACDVYWRASLVGSPRVLDASEQQAVIAAVLERGYGRR